MFFLKYDRRSIYFEYKTILLKKNHGFVEFFFRSKINEEVSISFKTCLNLRSTLYLYFVAANMTHIANNSIK